MFNDALLIILLSWASHLSGYPVPTDLPEVRYEPREFFVDNVCGGRECPAVGWYNDEGIVYIDQKYRGSDGDFASSLLVHEFVHYLQHKSGKFETTSCEDSLRREREAYRVQNEYIVEALASPSLLRPSPATCSYQ